MKEIVIVGGGSAGWMTATHLVRRYPYKITVIESPDIPTIGVGESTLQHIRLWMAKNCLDDEMWMPHCDGSYKVSIQFDNWDGKGTSFQYPFGYAQYVNSDLDAYHLLNSWNIQGVNGCSHQFADCLFPASTIAKKKKLVNELGGFNYKKQGAFHFDATLFGQWLKNNICLPASVNLISDTVADVVMEGNDVKKLVLSSGEEVTADYFIDCTGFKSLLMSKTDNEFKDYSDILPNNKAWATQIPETSDSLVTKCTTLGNGWVWEIPTKSRIGTGYVYSDKYTSDEDALKEFKEHLGRDDLEFKLINMRVGRYDKFAHGNIACIGLSYGFIEPLESNGLFTVHENLYSLERLIDSQWSNGAKLAISDAVSADFDKFADFVYQHYTFALRNDTPYWKSVGQKKGISVDNKYALINSVNNEFLDMYVYAGLFAVAIGMGFNPVGTREHAAQSFFSGQPNFNEMSMQIFSSLHERQQQWERDLDQMEEVPRSL